MSFEYRSDFGAYRGPLAEMHPRQCSFCSGVHFDASDTDAPRCDTRPPDPPWPMMKPHDVVDAPEVQAGQLSVTEIFAPAAKLWAEHCVPARAARLVCLRPAPRPRLAPASSPHALPLVSPPFPLPSPSPSHRPPSARRFDRHGFDRHGQARDVCSHSRRSVVSILRASGVARVY